MKLRNSVAASLLLLSTAQSVLAGSVTQPGDTMGSASGMPAPPGLYFADQANYGSADIRPRTSVFTDIPMLAWAMPWKILGATPVLVTAPTTFVHVDLHNTYHATGLFNPFVAGEVAWDLGHGFGFAYLLGAYIDVNSTVAYSTSSLNQRFGLSYTGNGWNLTENTILGIQFDQSNTDPQGFPCPTNPAIGCNPNFVNVDLTATKKFGNWEVGPIGFYSTDISNPVSDYRRQSKAAIGALVGYWSRLGIIQLYATTEFYERNYGGKDTRVWTRLIIPLGKGPPKKAIAY